MLELGAAALQALKSSVDANGEHTVIVAIDSAGPPPAAYATQLAYDAGGLLIYKGWASSADSNPAHAVWTIQKYTYDGSNRMTSSQWAGGNATANKIWDNRATLTYS